MASPREEWASLTERPGYLRLHAFKRPDGARGLAMLPNVLAQKWGAEEFVFTAEVDLSALKTGEKFGLAATGIDGATLEAERTERGVTIRVIQARAKKKDPASVKEKVLASREVKAVKLKLRAEVGAGGICAFSYDPGVQRFIGLGGRVGISEGWWTGAKTGFYCLGADGADMSGGYADIDSVVVGVPKTVEAQ